MLVFIFYNSNNKVIYYYNKNSNESIEYELQVDENLNSKYFVNEIYVICEEVEDVELLEVIEKNKSIEFVVSSIEKESLDENNIYDIVKLHDVERVKRTLENFTCAKYFENKEIYYTYNDKSYIIDKKEDCDKNYEKVYFEDVSIEIE